MLVVVVLSLLLLPARALDINTMCVGVQDSGCRPQSYVYNKDDTSTCYCDGDGNTLSCQFCPTGFGRTSCGCQPNAHGGGYTCQEGFCNDCAAHNAYSDSTNGLWACMPCNLQVPTAAQYIAQACDGTHDQQLAPCPAGSYCIGGVASPCPIGAYCPGGGVGQKPCAPTQGQQCPRAGMSAFERYCAVGLQLVARGGGVYECDACPAGSTSAPPSLSCTACAAGSALTADAVCATCSAGYYQPSAAATVCLACAAGQYQPAAGATACLPCPTGAYMPHAGGGLGCIQCLAGSYASASASTACTSCPVNTFAPAGASACTPCPAGQMTLAGGAIDASACLVCGARHAVVNGVCTVCPPFDPAQPATWFFCPGDGLAHAISPPRLGASFVLVASDGLVDNILAPCSTCPSDRYLAQPCTLARDGRCQPCSVPTPAYTYVATPCAPAADTVLATCQPADRLPGGRCNLCPPGTANCVPCPPNTFAAAYGATACTPCASGLSSDGGARFCARVCPPGQFAPSPASSCVSTPDQLPWRSLGPSPPQVGGLAQLDDGTRFATTRGGLLWRLPSWIVADGLGQGAPALAVWGPTTLFAAADDGVWRIDYHGDAETAVTPLTLAGVRRPVAVAAVSDGVLLADWDAHCVWFVDAARGQASAAVGADAGLANPSLLAVDAARLLVGDARGLWLMTTSAQGDYVCGGGATALASATALACADLDWAGAQFTGLAMAPSVAEEGTPAAFLLSPLYGVWLVALLPGGAPLSILRLRAGSGSSSLVYAQQQLLLADQQQLLVAGLAAFARLAPAPILHCLCDAGLYCNTTRQQCMPAPAGAIAPAWVNAPQPCPPGTTADALGLTCVPCPLPNAFTTYVAGSLQCVPRCASGQLYHEGACVAGCNASRGEYLEPQQQVLLSLLILVLCGRLVPGRAPHLAAKRLQGNTPLQGAVELPDLPVVRVLGRVAVAAGRGRAQVAQGRVHVGGRKGVLHPHPPAAEHAPLRVPHDERPRAGVGRAPRGRRRRDEVLQVVHKGRGAPRVRVHAVVHERVDGIPVGDARGVGAVLVRLPDLAVDGVEDDRLHVHVEVGGGRAQAEEFVEDPAVGAVRVFGARGRAVVVGHSSS